jgi:UDP-2,4-diacetamido-2,4,6-trideoxy-beta-L-altropyranose hydrolase
VGELLLFRADADSQMGVGHVMRCLALAQAWQDVGGRAMFVMAAAPTALEERLQNERCEVQRISAQLGSPDDAHQAVQLAQQRAALWVVVDGYQFGAAYQQMIKEAGLRLLVFDDYGHAGRYSADLVVNQNLYASEQLYGRRAWYTRLLLGTTFVPLRREFMRWLTWKQEVPAVARRVLILTGGGDPGGVSLGLLEALEPLPGLDGLEARLVIGPSYGGVEELERACQEARVPVRLERHVQDLAELMAWADVAIATGGVVSWELAFMGLPFLVVAAVDNQARVAESLSHAGIAISLGHAKELQTARVKSSLVALLCNPQLRGTMAARAHQLVDGHGAERLVRLLRREGFEWRPAREEDCRLIWGWANDPVARAGSFSPDPIPWEEHVRWFQRTLRDPNRTLSIATNGEAEAIGQVRYEITGRDAVVSVTVDRRFQGMGYGTALIRSAAQRLFAQWPVRTIHAYVKSGNAPSVRAFTKAGFTSAGTTAVQGQPAIHFVLHDDDVCGHDA